MTDLSVPATSVPPRVFRAVAAVAGRVTDACATASMTHDLNAASRRSFRGQLVASVEINSINDDARVAMAAATAIADVHNHSKTLAGADDELAEFLHGLDLDFAAQQRRRITRG